MNKRSLLLILFFAACATPVKTEHNIHKVITNNIHIRRPTGTGADAKVGPGGEDYYSDPLPNERFDCETIEDLFKKMDIEKVRECISNIKDNIVAEYELVRDAAPYLRLETNTKLPLPACLSEAVPQIPVPREIVFQSNEEGPLNCYSTRLNIEAGKTLGAKTPIGKLIVRANFPLINPPKDNIETIRLLSSWILTPFFEGKPPHIKAKIVTQQICKKCMGENGILKERGLNPAFWP